MTTYNLTKFKALKEEFEIVEAVETVTSNEMAAFVSSELKTVLACGFEVFGVVATEIKMLGNHHDFVIHVKQDGFLPVQLIFRYCADTGERTLQYLKTVHRAKVWTGGRSMKGDLLKVYFKDGLKVYDVLLDSGRWVTVTEDKLLHTYFL